MFYRLTLVVAAATRHEIDKLTASQRLDLNLEKGRMRCAATACLPRDARRNKLSRCLTHMSRCRDELQALRDKANELEIKIDKEINMLKAAVEARSFYFSISWASLCTQERARSAACHLRAETSLCALPDHQKRDDQVFTRDDARICHCGPRRR